MNLCNQIKIIQKKSRKVMKITHQNCENHTSKLQLTEDCESQWKYQNISENLIDSASFSVLHSTLPELLTWWQDTACQLASRRSGDH